MSSHRSPAESDNSSISFGGVSNEEEESVIVPVGGVNNGAFITTTPGTTTTTTDASNTISSGADTPTGSAYASVSRTFLRLNGRALY